MYKTTVCTNVNGDMQWLTRRKQQKIMKRWHYSAAHWDLVNVLVGNVTFLWFLLFSMWSHCSLHVAVNVCINCSFVHLCNVNSVLILMWQANLWTAEAATNKTNHRQWQNCQEYYTMNNKSTESSMWIINNKTANLIAHQHVKEALIQFVFAWIICLCLQQWCLRTGRRISLAQDNVHCACFSHRIFVILWLSR